MFTRRGLMGLFGGGAAYATVGEKLVARSHVTHAASLGSGNLVVNAHDTMSIASSGTKEMSFVEACRRDLLEHQSKTWRDFNTGASSLDPDLFSMRSISLSAALHMQAERNARRAYDSETNWLQKRLDQAIKSMSGGLLG